MLAKWDSRHLAKPTVQKTQDRKAIQFVVYRSALTPT